MVVDPSPVAPASQNVMMTPSVIDLDGDGVPDVVFSSYAATLNDTFSANGSLRALNGADGHGLFTVTDAAHQVAGLQPAGRRGHRR